MRVLVTGAAGFIGSVTSEQLLREGHEVIGLDNLVTRHRENVAEGVYFVRVDCGDQELVRSLGPIDACVHFAARIESELSMREPELFFANNVAATLRLGGLWRHGHPSRAAALADAYQRFPLLSGARNRSAGTLSGGERQILVIARALMASPRMLLLDEPSLGLAPRMVAQVMDLIRQLRDEAGLTVLLVEQNARSALAIADEGIVLNLGRVVAASSAHELAADVELRKHYLGF